MTDRGKKGETHTLTLSRQQLIHLRDLMSIRLPPRYTRTISADLAKAEKRVSSESKLWKAIYEICENAKISTGHDAPDFSLELAATPRLEVVQIDTDELE